jgi:hypothetical protein
MPAPSIGLAAAVAQVARQEGGPEIGEKLLRYKIENGDIPSWAKNVLRPDILWQHASVLIDECPVCRDRHILPVKVAAHLRGWVPFPNSLLLPGDWEQAEVAWMAESLSRRTYSLHPDWVLAYGIRLHLAKFEEAFPAPETAKSIEELDRELFSEIAALLATGKKLQGAALSLVAEGKVAGTGRPASKAKRLAKRYTEEVLRGLSATDKRD